MITLNDEQQYIVNQAVKWYNNSPKQLFQYDGPPGSGKSFVLNEIIRELGLNPTTDIAAMSFTGAASLVMRMKGLVNAKTAHSWIYNIVATPMVDKHGNVVMDELLNVPVMVPKFIPVERLDHNIKLIVIDEAYCLPRALRPTIEKFGIKILACGDQNQLPPVNDRPAFLASGKIYHLTQCMRQGERMDISFIATMRGMDRELLPGYYGNSLVINKNMLTDSMLMNADIIICGRNKTRDMINNKIRSILGYVTDLPRYGEKIVCRSNNWLESIPTVNGWEVNLVNGLTGRVINNPDVSTFDGKLFSMDFAPDMLSGEAFLNTRCNYKHMISDNEIRTSIRNNKYEPGNMFEYAYAITTYVSQGSQFHNVVYIEEPTRDRDMRMAMNLVGASRADTSLIYVKPF